MQTLVPIIFLLLGLFIGSFLNVVILRWGTGRSIITGRSVCADTGKVLPWYDLVPVLSFLFLGGKSRFSGKALSIQYPLVEILTGILFVLVYKSFGFDPLSVIYLIINCLLIVIAFYDLRTKIIPNTFVYLFIAFSFVIFLASPSFWGFWAAPILWSPFAFLWFVSKGTWMGYGDAKLAWGMGWLLGLQGGLSAVVLSFWIGAAVALSILALKKLFAFLPQSITIKSEIPFAPFLVIGTLLVLFFHLNVFLF